MKQITVVIGLILLAWLITSLIPGDLTSGARVCQTFFTLFILMWLIERYKNRN